MWFSPGRVVATGVSTPINAAQPARKDSVMRRHLLAVAGLLFGTAIGLAGDSGMLPAVEIQVKDEEPTQPRPLPPTVDAIPSNCPSCLPDPPCQFLPDPCKCKCKYESTSNYRMLLQAGRAILGQRAIPIVVDQRRPAQHTDLHARAADRGRDCQHHRSAHALWRRRR